MAADVLYISFDGVLQPLPFSQVVRVVAAIARRGWRYHLLSVERPAELENLEVRAAVEETLREANVGWTRVAAPSMGSSRLALEALARVVAKALAITRREGIALVHARGYQSAIVARALKRLRGIPYVFDARGYWIEERARPGEWFSTAASYAMGKWTEQVLFRGAEAVVTLTTLQALDVAAGLFGPPPRVLEVIPTCADYDAFYLRDSRPAKPGAGRGGADAARPAVPDGIRSQLAGKVVIGVVGAFNATYFVDETLALARKAIERSATAHLLVLSSQIEQYGAALDAIGVPRGRYTLAAPTQWEMPEWLQWIDWGMLLVPEIAANRAKMPTKLAEFFATGVRPVFFGCNSDVADWVRRAGSGHVLSGLDEAGLDGAARVIVDSPASFELLRTACEITAPHFSLTSGVERYHRLLATCLSRGPSGPASPSRSRRALRDDNPRFPLNDPGSI
jgi:Glycosyl transferase 4-like domain